ncbi:hypothetical protein EC973_008014 [Apophysomyces ossiformis]|uniref:Uncharacterized protein n=1 Tax=Apophysomyces ossiformis TaxID=679940 RepID=A0A8H7BE08_9FUNG|nr:hypothetical protein EC973_008014 [Apophysomyces ossiformis]
MGLQGEISTIHLDECGMYVALFGTRIFFPPSHASIKIFLPTLKALLNLRADLESTVMLVLEQLDLAKEKRESFGPTFSRSSSTLPACRLKSLKKDTWFSPPPS